MFAIFDSILSLPFAMPKRKSPGQKAVGLTAMAIVSWYSEMVRSIEHVKLIQQDDDSEHGEFLVEYHEDQDMPHIEWNRLIYLLANPAGRSLLCGKVQLRDCADSLKQAKQVTKQLNRWPNPFAGRLWRALSKTASPDFSRIFSGGLTEREQKIMATAYRHAKDVLTRDDGYALRHLAARLQSKGQLTGLDFREFLGSNRGLNETSYQELRAGYGL